MADDQITGDDGSKPSQEEVDPGLALETDLRKAQEQRDSLFEQLARVQADFRNAQKRLEVEKQLQVQFANASLLRSLLPAIDNFERALDVDPAKVESATMLKGMQIVHDQIIALLQAQNVEIIAPQPGVPFDPNQHESLFQEPSDKFGPATVTQLLRKGYSLHGRVLRPAQVAVSKTE